MTNDSLQIIEIFGIDKILFDFALSSISWGTLKKWHNEIMLKWFHFKLKYFYRIDFETAEISLCDGCMSFLIETEIDHEGNCEFCGEGQIILINFEKEIEAWKTNLKLKIFIKS